MILTIYLGVTIGMFLGTWLMDFGGASELWEHIFGAFIWPIAVPYVIYLKFTYGR